MIEQFKIKNQKGTWWVVCPILPLVAAIFACSFWLSRPSLRRVPKCCITDSYSLGSSLFWGYLYLAFGLILLFPFLLSDMLGNPFFSLFILPFPFIGLFLLLHRAKYQKYKLLIDHLLVILVEKNNFRKSDFCFYYHSEQYSYDKVIPLIMDLQYSGILTFAEDDATVSYRFAGVDVPKQMEYEERVWDCCSCGAKNKQRVIVGESASCEYCQTPQM